MVNNPYIIIQARMNSQRLPGKVMRQADGKPLIGILMDRLSGGDIPVLMATSVHPENDELAECAEKKGAGVFRGSEDNVLERYYLAARSVKADLIFRLTGDNPFVDGCLVKKIFEKYIQKGHPRAFISTGLSRTFPLGISVEAFSFALLGEAFNNAVLPGETEHVTPYMHQNRPGDIEVIPFKDNLERFHYRLTVDTPKDFELFKTLVEDHQAAEATIPEIIRLLDDHPDLVKINSGEMQKPWA